MIFILLNITFELYIESQFFVEGVYFSLQRVVETLCIDVQVLYTRDFTVLIASLGSPS